MIPRCRTGSQKKASRRRFSLDPPPLFSSQQPLRPMRVMVDANLMPEEFSWAPTGLLAGLLTHELIQLYRYADDGPPASVPRTANAWGDGEHVKGWAVLGGEDRSYQMWPVQWADEDGITDGAVSGNATEAAERDDRNAAYRDLPPDGAANRRRADALAAQVAETIQADIYITERPYLHALTWSLAQPVTFLRPAAALPFVSLYLRAQRQFYVYKWTPGSATVNRGLFYWIGTREYLPAAWRWFSACVQHSQGGRPNRLLYTGQSALQRVDRALELRDLVHVALNQPQDNDVADDALVSFDSCLVFLMGALDAVARVAHETVLPDRNPRSAGWQRGDWLKQLERGTPQLAAVVAPGSPGGATLTVLTTLRNTVHSAGLTAVGIATATAEREGTAINLASGVDTAELGKLLAAVDALGGRQSWGLERSLPGLQLVDPGVLLEQLFPRVLRLLDELMRETPVEGLAGVSLTPKQTAPPSDPHGTFSERNRQSIRWQLGLDEPTR
jgi:hypothetical protein